jgi:NADH dehydrogenase FAD-containing subunit
MRDGVFTPRRPTGGIHLPIDEKKNQKLDRFGRLPVDQFMKVKGVPNVFAAGDVAWTLIDNTHASVMSCQHGRPMGRFAGHNVICDLFGCSGEREFSRPALIGRAKHLPAMNYSDLFGPWPDSAISTREPSLMESEGSITTASSADRLEVTSTLLP